MLVIGGGITGAGIAFDAASRGVKTALVEMADFASGTSSRSTKLIHGGLRYLKQGHLRQVSQLGRERTIVHTNGPHITRAEWMLLPIYKRGSLGCLTTSIGLKLYDYLAQVKKAEQRKMLSIEEALEKEPLLKRDGLLGAGYYVEYQTDDARLTIEILKATASYHAHLFNYMKVESFMYDTQSHLVGVNVVDQLTKQMHQIKAKVIVNATGPWVDTIRMKDHTNKSEKSKIQHSKGIHLVIDRAHLPIKQPIYFDTFDGRMVFAIPRSNKTYVGTTDTAYDGALHAPKVTKLDVTYLLQCIHDAFPTVRMTSNEIESSWAGLRPLIAEKGKDTTTQISRKDEIWLSKSGLITIAGGKLTGYRKMAEKVVSLVIKQLRQKENREFSICQTKEARLSGGSFVEAADLDQFIQEKGKEATAYGLNEQEGERLASIYGTNVDQLFAFVKEADGSLPRIDYAQLMYAIHAEMAHTLTDFFIRRTSDLYFNIEKVNKLKRAVTVKMASLFHWTKEEQENYVAELDKALVEATIFQL